MKPATALDGVTTSYALPARVFDLALTTLLIPLVAPLALLIALAVVLDSPGPVL